MRKVVRGRAGNPIGSEVAVLGTAAPLRTNAIE
jgi:hypothetical protein